MLKAKGAIEMHERRVVISEYGVSHTFHCVTPSSCTMISQELSSPCDEQHLHNHQTCLFNSAFNGQGVIH